MSRKLYSSKTSSKEEVKDDSCKKSHPTDYIQYMNVDRLSNYNELLSAYTKSKLKDKSKLVVNICNFLNELERIYTSLPRHIMYSQFLKRKICIYSGETVITLIQNEDWKGLQIMLNEQCCDVDEIIILVSVYAPTHISKIITNISEAHEHLHTNNTFWLNQAEYNGCIELQQLCYKIEETKTKQAEEQEQKQTKLKQLLQEVGCDKEELMSMLQQMKV